MRSAARNIGQQNLTFPPKDAGLQVAIISSPLTPSASAAVALAAMPAALETNTIVIEGVTWDAYLQMDKLLDDAPVRMKWADDRLEIMSPVSRYHELIKSNIGRMVVLFCRRRGLFFLVTAGATMCKERQRAGEPDDSYIFTRGKETTDLVIETSAGSRGLEMLDFYRPLEIPEVWVWEDGALHAHAFHDGEYVLVRESRFPPGLDLGLIERWAEHPYTSEALDEFERELARLD